MKDSVVFEYPSVKQQRHEFFAKRKRMQKAKQTAFETVVQTEERDYVHDCLHKVSRQVVEWVSQFSNPVIVFEDPKDMRDSIDYGTRMNRRLHSLPFAALQDMVSYKAAWMGIPSDTVAPEYKAREARLGEEPDEDEIDERPDDPPDDVPSKATITIKEINDNRYYYWQWREGDKVKSKYKGPGNPDR